MICMLEVFYNQNIFFKKECEDLHSKIPES